MTNPTVGDLQLALAELSLEYALKAYGVYIRLPRFLWRPVTRYLGGKNIIFKWQLLFGDAE